MKSLIFGILTLTSLQLQAHAVDSALNMEYSLLEAQQVDDKTHYQKLAELFSKGVSPKPEKIKDVLWKGRCFTKTEPNHPLGGLLILKKDERDAGPISSGQPNFQGCAVTASTVEAMEGIDEKKLLSFCRIDHSYVDLITTGGVTKLVSGYHHQELKVSGKYLLLRLLNTKTKNVYAYCYYFEPEQQ